MLKNMLNGIRIFSSDPVWRQIVSELDAAVFDAPELADVNIDTLDMAPGITIPELKVAIVAATDNDAVVRQIFGPGVTVPPSLARVAVLLHKSGGMTAGQLRDALGYSRDATTHAIEAAIYQLRRVFGRDFIQNNDGVYRLGKL